MDQAFDALEGQIRAWAEGQAKPDLRVFVYQPDHEAQVLHKLPEFAQFCAEKGWFIKLEDVGLGVRNELEHRKEVVDRLEGMDRDHQLSDLEHIASGYLVKILRTPLRSGAVCRILMNTGSIATFVSYSAIANELAGNGAETGVPATVIAFPGEGDDRSLNMLGLRNDTNYRVPRI